MDELGVQDVIDDTGHLTPLEQPEKVNKMMKRWLL
jgi:hypothetical protein